MNRAAFSEHKHDLKHYPMKTPLHYLVAARQSEMAELEQISRASTLVASMSELVHALQKERGLSNIFLASGGAQAQQVLQAHLPQVDEAMARVCGVLEALGERSPGAHGVGLGLSLVRRIVEAHGGTASAVNVAQGGAEVTFVLPLVPHPA